ncbi:SDR family oxidoreductase [Rhodococcus sp. NPDC058514]|uniref:SDR family oxidoreductase n=1 Tax=unclassified Rhodococcus (in: high G+C Gram-positive bacteria) TaxID=192944 RepID=UPI00364D82C8
MRIVVVGGTGHIGRQVVDLLGEQGHEVVAAAPSTGVDTVTGDGLAQVLTGADVVVDVTGPPSYDGPVVVDFFARSTANQIAAESVAGVRHHVALSIVGVDRLVPSDTVGYLDGKVRQEEIIAAGPVPSTVLRATQFHEFIATIADVGTRDDGVHLPHILFQPVAAADVARLVAEVAAGEPRGVVEIAGSTRAPMDELIGAVLRGRGDERVVVRDDEVGYFGARLADDGLVPVGDGAVIGTTGLPVTP